MAKCKMWVNMESKGVESKMERKTYKVILNIGYKNESVKYFDRLTKNRIAELKESNAYVILYYDKFFEKYLWFDSKTNEYQKALFNSNLEYYCNKKKKKK